MHVMQGQSKVSGTPQPESVVDHQPLSTGHGIDNPMVAHSSTANGTVAQPFASSMLDASTHPADQLQPMEVISTTP